MDLRLPPITPAAARFESEELEGGLDEAAGCPVEAAAARARIARRTARVGTVHLATIPEGYPGFAPYREAPPHPVFEEADVVFS